MSRPEGWATLTGPCMAIGSGIATLIRAQAASIAEAQELAADLLRRGPRT